ncbi:hypothetical protein Q5424_01775 [Conexibacter sp. JD483]|uniref:hypothetical protein n=1 Tax=unclassified Conexibacter TaxID=2627773 RepID=UPI00271F7CFF|nr:MULTISPECIES: hypothetical protein [unclassified Conexibacter]MDO8185205.1 hypothetical protein [Conexibacter sp. CPCC 205706]MDO8198251.1 hypothetical protein [Conexibacter sp. CPCC 205762]MDR9367787.1 hypothetical protein [Conexibacter sp. JD483]
MPQIASLPTASTALAGPARARTRGARASRRPGLAARGATLARLLLVPGAAVAELNAIGDRPDALPSRAPHHA